MQVVTDPAGRLLWVSPALPGRAHDLTAARTHRIIRICERQGVPILVDRDRLRAAVAPDHPRGVAGARGTGAPSSYDAAPVHRGRETAEFTAMVVEAGLAPGASRG